MRPARSEARAGRRVGRLSPPIGFALLGAAGLTTALAAWAGAFGPDGVRAWGGVGVAAVVSALVPSLWLWARERSRVSRVASSAEALAAGDWSRRVRGEGDLGSLASSLESMAAQLSALAARLSGLQRQHDAVLRSMEGGVIVLDMQQRILSVSHAGEAMLGLGAGKAAGRLIQEATRQPELNRFVGEAMAGRIAAEAELSIQGDRARRVRGTACTLLDEQARPIGLLVVLTDVTRLRRLEAVRTDFAANVSHELRTPITNIKGYAETLLETGLSDSEQSLRFLTIIARNAERLGAIVEDMLMLTQLERPDSREALATEWSRIQPILSGAVAEHESAARAKGIRLVVECPDDLHAAVNPQLIQLAVGNLAGNAIKYGPAGTRVHVRAAPASGLGGSRGIELCVEDEGPGIAPEHLARIFERFYRVEKARSREQGGTGLGLAIVKHIAQLHSGRVDVDSTLGRGSVFRLLIPIGAPENEARPAGG